MNTVAQFNSDIHAKEDVLSYCVAYFESEIIRKARLGEDVSSMAEAINNLEKAFIQMSIDYDPKPKPVEETNTAR